MRRFDRAACLVIERAVGEVEGRHAGEIRVAIETALDLPDLYFGVTAQRRSLAVFGLLGVWDTAANNGVLIYVLMGDRSVEIVADRAAARAIDEAQWRAITAELAAAFRKGDYAEGTLRAVDRIGELLAKAFPAGDAPADELPNRPALL